MQIRTPQFSGTTFFNPLLVNKMSPFAGRIPYELSEELPGKYSWTGPIIFQTEETRQDGVPTLNKEDLIIREKGNQIAKDHFKGDTTQVYFQTPLHLNPVETQLMYAGLKHQHGWQDPEPFKGS